MILITFSTGYPNCDYSQDKVMGNSGHYTQIGYFCGHLPVCRKFNNKIAFEIAISNVQNYYSVVGITEEMKKSLTVMEKKLPNFFNGVSALIENEVPKDKRNINHFKPKVSQHVKDLLKANFSYEFDFYQFCKNRLQEQFKSL